VFELITGKRAWHKTPHGHAEVPASPSRRPQLEHAHEPSLESA